MTTLTRSLRYAESEVVAYRRTWRGTVISTFVNPLFYLLAMGVGLGAMVDSGQNELAIPYVTLVATGLLAANAMTSAAGDSSFPVMAGILWRKNFYATITTPLGPADIIYGRLIWGTARLAFVLGVFTVIAAILGALDLGPGLLAILPAILTGLAFSTCVTAWTLKQNNGATLSTFFRFAITPLFLFSGTFFPISQLPDWLEAVAYATPLFHGVELVRKIALPDADASIVTSLPLWVHALYLVVMLLIGLVLSLRFLDERIRP